MNVTWMNIHVITMRRVRIILAHSGVHVMQDGLEMALSAQVTCDNYTKYGRPAVA